MQRRWGDYITKASASKYRDASHEAEAYEDAAEGIRKLIDRCKAAGFKYYTICGIIPPPCKTTHMERLAALEDLREYTEEKHAR